MASKKKASPAPSEDRRALLIAAGAGEQRAQARVLAEVFSAIADASPVGKAAEHPLVTAAWRAREKLITLVRPPATPLESPRPDWEADLRWALVTAASDASAADLRKMRVLVSKHAPPRLTEAQLARGRATGKLPRGYVSGLEVDALFAAAVLAMRDATPGAGRDGGKKYFVIADWLRGRGHAKVTPAAVRKRFFELKARAREIGNERLASVGESTKARTPK